MLLKDKKQTENQNDNQPQVCIYDDTTLICGNIVHIDYNNRVESKMVVEPFYGDIDLFGF